MDVMLFSSIMVGLYARLKTCCFQFQLRAQHAAAEAYERGSELMEKPKSVKVIKKSVAWAKKQLQEFFKVTPHVILGTGTSCAVDVGFGMGALKDSLLAKIKVESLDEKSARQWARVEKALKDGSDVEHSLDFATTDKLRELILKETGASVAHLDQKFSVSICRRETEWPAMAIVNKIISGLTISDHNALNVITTNYDLLFEYACAAYNIKCVDGFCGSIIKSEDWPASLQTVCYKTNVVRNRRENVKNVFQRHVRLYKVHGSLNRFFINNEVVEVDMWIGAAPAGIERVIITPGSSKYEKIQKYRKELQAKADKSVESANGFLFLGYGMNDAHIEQYIVQKIRKDSKPAIFITRDLNDRIKDFAKQNDSVWVVCGMEDPNEGTRIFSGQLGGWLSIPGNKLWEFSQFANQIM